MLLTFTDAVTKNSVAINSVYVVAVFTALEGDQAGKTIIGLTNGNLVVDESYDEVVLKVQAQ